MFNKATAHHLRLPMDGTGDSFEQADFSGWKLQPRLAPGSPRAPAREQGRSSVSLPSPLNSPLCLLARRLEGRRTPQPPSPLGDPLRTPAKAGELRAFPRRAGRGPRPRAGSPVLQGPGDLEAFDSHTRGGSHLAAAGARVSGASLVGTGVRGRGTGCKDRELPGRRGAEHAGDSRGQRRTPGPPRPAAGGGRGRRGTGVGGSVGGGGSVGSGRAGAQRGGSRAGGGGVRGRLGACGGFREAGAGRRRLPRGQAP